MRGLIAVCGLALGLAWGGASPLFAQAAPEKPKFDQLIEGKTKVTGMWTLYHKDQLLLAEIKPEHIGRDFIVLPTIARGISQMPIIGGMSWSTGDDDMLWNFRKVDDKLMLQRRNVRFKAKAGSPEASAVEKAYSDSVLFALPIIIHMALHPWIERHLQYADEAPPRWSWAILQGLTASLLIVGIRLLAAPDSSDFIYFQF